jgi:hypothetical protein
MTITWKNVQSNVSPNASMGATGIDAVTGGFEQLNKALSGVEDIHDQRQERFLDQELQNFVKTEQENRSNLNNYLLEQDKINPALNINASTGDISIASLDSVKQFLTTNGYEGRKFDLKNNQDIQDLALIAGDLHRNALLQKEEIVNTIDSFGVMTQKDKDNHIIDMAIGRGMSLEEARELASSTTFKGSTVDEDLQQQAQIVQDVAKGVGEAQIIGLQAEHDAKILRHNVATESVRNQFSGFEGKSSSGLLNDSQFSQVQLLNDQKKTQIKKQSEKVYRKLMSQDKYKSLGLDPSEIDPRIFAGVLRKINADHDLIGPNDVETGNLWKNFWNDIDSTMEMHMVDTFNSLEFFLKSEEERQKLLNDKQIAVSALQSSIARGIDTEVKEIMDRTRTYNLEKLLNKNR